MGKTMSVTNVGSDNDTEDETIARANLDLRLEAATAKYQDGPGRVDITFGKVGARWGFLVTMERYADLGVTVSCPLIDSDITIKATGIGFRHSGYTGLPEEHGASIDKCFDRIVVSPHLIAEV